MNILVTGATGFIASQIVTDLLIAGHKLTGCVRNTHYAKTIFPSINVLSCNFVHDTDPQVWLPRLKDIDIVINCVGIFYHPNKAMIWSIHHDTPKALFDACVQAGVKKIIHISALGIESSTVNYSLSKKAIEGYLLSLPVPSIILRPSFVYGRGSYGGSSLFRGLVGLPWITPIPGKGMQQFQPIHLEDLSKAIAQLVEKPLNESILLSAVSAKRLTLNDILVKLRAWLGFPKAKLLHMPLWMIRVAGYFGSFIPYSTINSDSYQLLIQDNISSPEDTIKFEDAVGFTPRNFDEGISSQPSSVQDRWHSRLFFLKPALKLSLVFVWLFTAICTLFLYPKNASLNLLAHIGVSHIWQSALLYSAGILDAILGLAMLFDYKIKQVIGLQIMVMLGYMALITWKLPYLWLEPLGPITKNIPLIVATLIYWAIEEER